MKLLRLVPAPGVAAALAPAAPALAADHCVEPLASCDPMRTYADLQAAINAAIGAPGNERVLLPAGTLMRPRPPGSPATR